MGAEESDGAEAQHEPRGLTTFERLLPYFLGVVLVVGAWWAYSMFRLMRDMTTYEPVDKVNAAADWLIVNDRARELEEIARRLRTRASELEISAYLSRMDDPELTRMVPERFWLLGGQPRYIVIRTDSVALHWPLFANGYHEIVVFQDAPVEPPTGYFGRIVNDRVYVVSYHCQRCGDHPAGHARVPVDGH